MIQVLVSFSFRAGDPTGRRPDFLVVFNPKKDKDQGRKLPTIEVEVVEEVPK
jgi:hypothetical protein